jgi:hypothetical protein
MIHDLKTWPEYYGAVVRGEKPFEVRKDDRGFKVGDTLHLREYDPVFKEYTGRTTLRRVTYMLADFVALEPGYCVLGLAHL